MNFTDEFRNNHSMTFSPQPAPLPLFMTRILLGFGLLSLNEACWIRCPLSLLISVFKDNTCGPCPFPKGPQLHFISRRIFKNVKFSPNGKQVTWTPPWVPRDPVSALSYIKRSPIQQSKGIEREFRSLPATFGEH